MLWQMITYKISNFLGLMSFEFNPWSHYLILKEAEKERISFVPLEYADYSIQDSRLLDKRGCPPGFMEHAAITVDGMKISRLCKKIP